MDSDYDHPKVLYQVVVENCSGSPGLGGSSVKLHLSLETISGVKIVSRQDRDGRGPRG